MENSRFIDIPIGGQWSAGDPTEAPDGTCTVCRNYFVRPNRLESRPPFVYDSLMSIRGLFNYDDKTNRVSRLMALNATPNLFMKGTSGETWSASLGSPGGTRITDFTQHRGKTYYAMDNGSGVPSAINSFDGTNLSSSPFNSAITGRCITSYINRLFVLYPRVTVTPLNTLGEAYMSATWTALSGGNLRTIISGTSTVRRFFPASGATPILQAASVITVSGSASDLPFTVRQDVRPVDGVNETTITAKVYLSPNDATLLGLTANCRNQAVTVGQLGSEASGATNRLMRCITAGTTALVAPAFNLNLGLTTNDGTAVWLAESDWQVGQHEYTVPSASAEQTFGVFTFPVSVPWRTNDMNISINYEFDATNLSPVDLSLMDGIADGDARKRNYGFQITAGEYHYPFVNTESAATSAQDIDELQWSEIDVTRFRASRTYSLQDIPGYPTAGTVLGKRYIAHKRNGFFVFTGNQDLSSLDVIPIRLEKTYKGIGCIGPRAHDEFMDVHYFIGEDDVYMFTIGMDEPIGICGLGMREEIMNRGSNWVESQSTYNMPLLKVDQKSKHVWVYTQKSTLYCYSLELKQWTKHDVNSAEIADMMFNPNTRKMYFAIGGYGLARLDWSAASANDTIDNTANTYAGTCEIVTRPIELFPEGVDATIDSLGIFGLASEAQTGATLTANVSFDRGSTYPYSNTVTYDTTLRRNPIELFESAPSITLKLTRTGKMGANQWSISKLDADVIVMGGEWPQAKPTSTSATL